MYTAFYISISSHISFLKSPSVSYIYLIAVMQSTSLFIWLDLFAQV